MTFLWCQYFSQSQSTLIYGPWFWMTGNYLIHRLVVWYFLFKLVNFLISQTKFINTRIKLAFFEKSCFFRHNFVKAVSLRPGKTLKISISIFLFVLAKENTSWPSVSMGPLIQPTTDQNSKKKKKQKQKQKIQNVQKSKTGIFPCTNYFMQHLYCIYSHLYSI